MPLKKTLQNILHSIESIGGETRELIFEAPSTEDELIAIEKDLGHQIPDEFRKILLTISGHCDLSWFLPDDFELPDALDEIFSGNLEWGTKFIIDFHKRKEAWIKEVFPNPEDEYDKVWYNKFVFQAVGNGDFLAIALDKEDYGKIVYLSHDGGEGHGYILANSFEELLSNWGEIGFVGAEDWQWLPFVENERSGILADNKNAIRWKELIGLN